jgi:hypothetical protein
MKKRLLLLACCVVVAGSLSRGDAQDPSIQTRLAGKWTQHYTGMSLEGATLNITSVDSLSGRLSGKWVPPSGPAGGKEYLLRLFVRDRHGRVVHVRVAEITRLTGADDYVELHVRNTSHLVKVTLNEFEKRLDPKLFAAYTDRPSSTWTMLSHADQSIAAFVSTSATVRK